MHFIENYVNKDDGMGSPLQIYDDSMEPLIPEGSFVFVDKYQKPESGDVVFAGSIDSMGMLKTTVRRYIKDSFATQHLEPINTEWKKAMSHCDGTFCFMLKVVGYALTETDFQYNLKELMRNKKEGLELVNESESKSE